MILLLRLVPQSDLWERGCRGPASLPPRTELGPSPTGRDCTSAWQGTSWEMAYNLSCGEAESHLAPPALPPALGHPTLLAEVPHALAYEAAPPAHIRASAHPTPPSERPRPSPLHPPSGAPSRAVRIDEERRLNEQALGGLALVVGPRKAARISRHATTIPTQLISREGAPLW